MFLTVRSRLITKTVLLGLLLPAPAFAEIIPDATLPENTRVDRQGNVRVIERGTQRGNNLFHSFQEFSLPTGGTAYFNNTGAIANIFARVTGGSRSTIDGMLQANGTANLFLLNPSGILFGHNASLNIGGSFLATTADRIDFADKTQFSAVNPQTSLLTVSVPVGLQFGSNPQPIVNQSRYNFVANEERDYPISGGLQVHPGQTLALIGGAIQFPGGVAIASGGQIELGSVAEAGTVALTPSNSRNWRFDYSKIQAFQDIQLSAEATIGTSGERGGRIGFQGRDIFLTGDSQVSADTLGAGRGQPIEFNATSSVRLIDGSDLQSQAFGVGQAGGIIIRAGNSIELSDVVGTVQNPNYTSIGSQSDNGTSGNGGNIFLKTRRLTVRNGAFVSASTFGDGQAGNILVNASDTVEILVPLDGGLDQSIPSGIYTQTEGDAKSQGDSGSLSIKTRQLALSNGTFLSTATYTQGAGGNLTVIARDRIHLTDLTPNATRNQGRSGIFASAEPEATGAGGDLNITTDELIVDNRAEVSVNNRGTGSPGLATINAGRLIVRNGGEIRASSAKLDQGATLPNQGDGGTLLIHADSIQVIGSGTIRSETFPSTIAAFSETSGNAGDLQITANHLAIRDGATITVSGTSTGSAGNLTIAANLVQLDQGSLTAETRSGSGASVILRDLNLLSLQNQSRISAEALNNANGGNVIIAADAVTAVPNQNNDILANADRGNGGNIFIFTRQPIAGFEQPGRTLSDRTNDINASSQLGQSGTVSTSFPIDTELQPLTLASAQPVQGCQVEAGQAAVSFFNTGHGGLPPTPYESLSSTDILDDVRLPIQETGFSGSTGSVESTAAPQNNLRPPIVEAQGWKVSDRGQVILVATASSDPSVELCHLR